MFGFMLGDKRRGKMLFTVPQLEGSCNIVLFPGASMRPPAASGGGMTEKDKVRMYPITFVGSGSSSN